MKQGVTLEELVNQHTQELYERAYHTNVQLAEKLGRDGERSKVRFVKRSNGFDFIRILQCSASLKPLI